MGVGAVIALLLIATAVVCLWLAVRSHRRGWQRRLPEWTRRPLPPAPRRRVRADVPHVLYGYRWRWGGDAYFGISNEPEVRRRRHEKAEWFALTTGVMHELRWYPNRQAAELAEAAAIRREAEAGALLANVRHNPYPGRWRQHV